MSDGARLPQFVLEALEDEGSAGEARGTPASGGARVGSSAELEHCFANLLEAAWAGGAPVDAVNAAAAEAPGPSSALFERLEATLGKAPHRYAPFYSRAAELFDLSEEAVVAELSRLAEPKVWRFAGLPGIHDVGVRGGPKVESAETLFVRFAPGVQFPKHRHTGLERVLVLEGSYVDTTGVVHRAGELREWAEGTEHGFRVDAGQPCIFASVVFGRRFSAWPLRALASVLGR
jgi:hypothetical protein